MSDTPQWEDAMVQAQADRGRDPARGHQPRVSSGEVDPAWPPVHLAPVVGASAAGGLPRSAIRPAGR